MPVPSADHATPFHRAMRLALTAPPEILADAEVLALMRACGESETGLRNQALIAVMYRSGLRVAEALSLYPKDVDAAAGTVRMLCGKG